MLVATKKIMEEIKVLKSMKKKFKKKDLGLAIRALCMDIIRDIRKCIQILSQEMYLKQYLRNLNIED